MSKNQKKKTPIYPWDSISCILAAIISFGVVMGIMGVDSLLVVGIVFIVLALIFEVIAYAAFPKQIAKYKEKIDAEEKAKEEEKKAKALALKPHEQAFYDKFTRILKTLSEEQFEVIRGAYARLSNLVKSPPILYAETMALSDYYIAKQFARKGNQHNFEVMKAYYDEMLKAAGWTADYKNNAPIKGAEFGVITTNAADTMLYGAIVANDIKKQARRIDYTSKTLFESKVVEARTKLFNKAKI